MYPALIIHRQWQSVVVFLKWSLWDNSQYAYILKYPCRNDEKEEISMDTLSKLAEIGAFGALVPEEYDGAGLNNTQFARLAEVVGESDLSLGVVMGAHQVCF